MRKKLLALLLAAALALSLLAGCGGGESVASALLKLLDGRYPNISIEIDPDLEADLRQAIRKAEAENAGDDAAVIRAALEKLVGSTITFRNLRNGQKGETAFDLVFYSGSDPGKAAQAAYSQWNPILSNVPADGQYDTSLAMVETNSGVWMLVKATVEKAGTVDKPDKDDDEPETEKPKDPYTDNKDGSYTVNTKDGLQKLYNDLENAGNFATAKITLESPVTLDENWKGENITFTGELNGNNHKITMTGTRTQGLFNKIDKGGTVQDVDIQVTGTIYNSSYDVGAVAGVNRGTIQNCHVTGGKIESSFIGSGSVGGVGGVVGFNSGGSVNNCYSTNAVNGGGYAGGVVGYNYNSGTVNDCYSTGTVSCGPAGGYAGGVVGLNSQYSSVTGCYHADGEVSGGIAGGVVGWNDSSTVIACYSTGNVTGNEYTGGVVGYNEGATITACYHAGTVQGGSKNGGVVGRNWTGGTVNDCYWSGQVSGGYGIGYDDYYISPTNANANQVTDNGGTNPDSSPVNWNTAKTNLSKYGYTFDGDMDAPTLTKKP